jgi:hypothetical protein
MGQSVNATIFLKSVLPPASTRDAPVRETMFNAESAALDRCAGEGWLAVGDAATAFDPIASQGLPNALASGNAAAHAAHRWLGGEQGALERYAAEMSAAYDFYLAGLRRHYQLERRWPDCTFWKARHAGNREQSTDRWKSRWHNTTHESRFPA